MTPAAKAQSLKLTQPMCEALLEIAKTGDVRWGSMNAKPATIRALVRKGILERIQDRWVPTELGRNIIHVWSHP